MRVESSAGSRQSAESRQLSSAGFLATVISRLSTRLHLFACAARGIAGMPDYQRYVEHLRLCHPEQVPVGEREFFADYLRARYADGPNRCC